MNFFIEMSSKGSNAAGHNINDRIFDLMFFYVLAASIQCCNIIINGLRRANLRDINLETMCIVELELVIIDSGHTFHFCFIHAAVTVSLTRHMIFNIFLILMVLRELVNKGFISTVCT